MPSACIFPWCYILPSCGYCDIYFSHNTSITIDEILIMGAVGSKQNSPSCVCITVTSLALKLLLFRNTFVLINFVFITFLTGKNSYIFTSGKYIVQN